MTKTISLIIGAVLIFGVGALVHYQTKDVPITQEESTPNAVTETETTTTPTETTAAETGTTQTAEGMTSAEVANHADKSSCWSIINGNVYDLTSWIPKHPGGEQGILGICGKDGSSKFNGQHGGAATQAKILAGFKIGVVK